MLFEANGNSALDAAKVNQATTSSQPGGNMEGKESRFGPPPRGCGAASTTGTSNGSGQLDARQLHAARRHGAARQHDARRGEPRRCRVGLYGMLVFALLSVFIAGLMVGRTPEYLGKKIQAAEMKLVVLYILAVPLVILLPLARVRPVGEDNVSIFNPGARVQRVLYAFTSAANNNGSAFAGLTANTEWMNTTLGIVMLVGRFFLIIPTLAIAGSLAASRPSPSPPARSRPTRRCSSCS